MFVGWQKISHNYRRPTNLQEADVFSHVCLFMEGRGAEGVSCDHHPWCIVPHCTGNPLVPAPSSRYRTLPQVWIWGVLGAWAPLDPRFWGPKIEHFWALFNFSTIFLPHFTWHIISLIFCFFIVQIQKFSSLAMLVIWFLTYKSLFLVLVSDI